MKRLPLTKLKANQKGKVVEIQGGEALRSRLMHLGIYENKEIIKLSHFLLRGPVTVRIGRSTLALGYGMANKIMLEIE